MAGWEIQYFYFYNEMHLHSGCCFYCHVTPLKFNMEAENEPLEREIPFWQPSFSSSMLNFRGVVFAGVHLNLQMVSMSSTQVPDGLLHSIERI